MTSCCVRSQSILRLKATRQRRLCADNQGHIFMYYSCKAQMNHEQFPMQMTQNSKHNKWLEMLAGKDFPPKLLWRTPTKIHRERRRRRQQKAAKQRDNRLAQRRQRRQHSDHKHVQRQGQNTTITLQMKPMKTGNTNCRRFKKRQGDQATLAFLLNLSSSMQRQAATLTRSVQCTSRISFQRTEDSLSAFTVSFILQ